MTDKTPVHLTIPPAVTEIAKRAKIKGINLVMCTCEVQGLAPGPNFEVTTALRGGSAVHETEPRTIVCSFGVTIRPLQADAAPFATISVDYAAQYQFDDETFFANMKEADRDSFAAFNTSFQLWPHVREFIQSMAARMGLPPIILPPFRPLEMIGAPDTWEKVPDDPEHPAIAARSDNR